MGRMWSPWTDRNPSLGGVPRNSLRVLALLNIAWGWKLTVNAEQSCPLLDEELMVGFYCDITQGVERLPWGGLSVLSSGTSDYITET